MTPISIPDFSLTEAEAFNVLQTQIIQVTTLTEPIHNRVQYRYVHLGYVCNSTDMPTSESTNCLGSCTKGEFEQINRHFRPDKVFISSSCYDVKKPNTRIFDCGKNQSNSPCLIAICCQQS